MRCIGSAHTTSVSLTRIIKRYLRRHGVKQVSGDENVGDEQGGLKLHPLNKHGQSSPSPSSVLLCSLPNQFTSQ